MRILFVTWDGPQVTYLESLFLPIFRGLGASGIHVDVIQFRWGEAALTEKIRKECEQSGVGYRAVPIWRRGSYGPMVSAFTGGRHIRKAVADFGSDVLMPRTTAAIPVLRAGGSKLRPIVFDADGLPVDERVEFSGLSPRSLTYRMLRDVEALMLQHASSVIVRTDKTIDIMCSRAGPSVGRERFHVVANGRDEDLFHPFDETSRAAVRRELGIAPDAPLLVYAGSIGTQYRFDLVRMLFDEVRRIRADARLLVLTGSPELAELELGEAAAEAVIRRVPPEEVPKYLAAADVGISYRAVAFSTQGVAPIKLSEYLLCGLPVVGTAAIGNTAPALDAGVFVDERSGAAAAARWVVNDVMAARNEYRQKARQVGQANFSLVRSVEDYLRALNVLFAATTPSSG